MKTWRRIRAALVLGLIWAAVWGGLLGFFIEAFVDPHGRIADIWPAVLGLPAFFGGAFFSAVLGIAERRRGIDDLSLPRVAAWGAVAGLLVGLLPFVLGEPTGGIPPWRLALFIIPPISLLSAVSAAGSLAIARKAKMPALLDPDADSRHPRIP